MGIPTRDGVCSSLKELSGAFESRETGLSVKITYGRTLAELLRDDALKSLQIS